MVPTLLDFVCDNTCIAKLVLEKGKHLLLLSTYFPPDKDRWKVQLRNLRKTIENIEERYKEYSLLVFGDFNEDLRDTRSEVRSVVKEFGLQVHFEESEGRSHVGLSGLAGS